MLLLRCYRMKRKKKHKTIIALRNLIHITWYKWLILKFQYKIIHYTYQLISNRKFMKNLTIMWDMKIRMSQNWTTAGFS